MNESLAKAMTRAQRKGCNIELRHAYDLSRYPNMTDYWHIFVNGKRERCGANTREGVAFLDGLRRGFILGRKKL